MEINNILNNEDNLYFGHGTGTANETVINSIMENGLRCSHGSLYYTSVILGMGKQIRDQEINLLKNWPHRASTIIVIVSLPIKYKIIDIAGIGTYNQGDAAYYYIPDEKQREKYDLTKSDYVRPEFIVGYYDANTDSFTKNPKYYENLSLEEQNILFQQVKENYFNIIDDGCGIEEYKEIADELGWKFGLTEEEVIKFKYQKDKEELLNQISPMILNNDLLLPSGEKIAANKYLENFVFPHIPLSGYIYLNSGAKIPVWHFIIECVIFDCQERYNGDFKRYLEENVQVDKLFKDEKENIR